MSGSKVLKMIRTLSSEGLIIMSKVYNDVGSTMKAKSDGGRYRYKLISRLTTKQQQTLCSGLGWRTVLVSADMCSTLLSLSIVRYALSFETRTIFNVGQVFGNGFALTDELPKDSRVTSSMINKHQ